MKRLALLIAVISLDVCAIGCAEQPYYAPEGNGVVEAGNGYGPGLGLNFERAHFKTLRVAIAAPPEPKNVDLVLSWRVNDSSDVKVAEKINYRNCGGSASSEVEFKLLGRFARAQIPGQPACLEVDLPTMNVNGESVELGTVTFRRKVGEFCHGSY